MPGTKILGTSAHFRALPRTCAQTHPRTSAHFRALARTCVHTNPCTRTARRHARALPRTCAQIMSFCRLSGTRDQLMFSQNFQISPQMRFVLLFRKRKQKKQKQQEKTKNKTNQTNYQNQGNRKTTSKKNNQVTRSCTRGASRACLWAPSELVFRALGFSPQPKP